MRTQILFCFILFSCNKTNESSDSAVKAFSNSDGLKVSQVASRVCEGEYLCVEYYSLENLITSPLNCSSDPSINMVLTESQSNCSREKFKQGCIDISSEKIRVIWREDPVSDYFCKVKVNTDSVTDINEKLKEKTIFREVDSSFGKYCTVKFKDTHEIYGRYFLKGSEHLLGISGSGFGEEYVEIFVDGGITERVSTSILESSCNLSDVENYSWFNDRDSSKFNEIFVNDVIFYKDSGYIERVMEVKSGLKPVDFVKDECSGGECKYNSDEFGELYCRDCFSFKARIK